ncbi:MAG: nicotinamide-nucleotide amidohydrolase family protein [Lentisphaeria bacterium]|nr:nicotinamide-nucleotide amidohydrolase family protein [Lentisphaeria bacterium]
MKIIIICTGSELLQGSVINTNATDLARQLRLHGMSPETILTIPDEMAILRDAVASSLQNYDLVIISGGLGPTADDITRDAVASALNLTQKRVQEQEKKLIDYWQFRHGDKVYPETYLNQANLPEYGEFIPNFNGTAPGIFIRLPDEIGNKLVAMLPGPPCELIPMLPELAKKLMQYNSQTVYMQTTLMAGIPELEVERRCGVLPDVGKTFCATAEGCKLTIFSTDREKFNQAQEQVAVIFNSACVNAGGLPEELLELMRKKHFTFAAAESCTGGLIAKTLTDIPGSSDVLLGSVVSYANEVKNKVLGVPEEILRQHGAVSRQCAEAMLNGVSKLMTADCALATTGIAGPGGGSGTKPVGLVYIGAKVGAKTIITENHFSGDRNAVRLKSCAQAMLMLRELLHENKVKHA